MSITDVFWSSSVEELKQGYVREGEYFTCLLCGIRTELGVIYPDDGGYYDAEKAMRRHIGKAADDPSQASTAEDIQRIEALANAATTPDDAILLGFYSRYVSLLLVPLLLGALSVHAPNGWVFNAPNGGWEYPAFLALAAFAQALIGDGALAIRPARPALAPQAALA